MLTYYLQNATEDIKSLIRITKQDMEDIKEARHESLFERTKIKEELISSFENKKLIVDNEIAKLLKENPNKAISELLDDNATEALNNLREALKELKELNKHYARMVLAVSEFYNSLLDKLIPSDKSGYEQNIRTSSFLQITA